MSIDRPTIEEFRDSVKGMRYAEGRKSYAAMQLDLRGTSEKEQAFLGVCQMAYRQSKGGLGEQFIRKVVEAYTVAPLTTAVVQDACREFAEGVVRISDNTAVQGKFTLN